MEFKGTMLLVKDMEKSKAFYTEVLGLEITMDLGVNVGFTGGVAVQSQDSWTDFTHGSNGYQYGGNDVELYFEVKDFDGFVKDMESKSLNIIGGGVLEMPYAQRVLRFYDPDMHIIQVGEDLVVMVKRFHREGLSVEDITAKTGLPNEAVEFMLNS